MAKFNFDAFEERVLDRPLSMKERMAEMEFVAQAPQMEKRKISMQEAKEYQEYLRTTTPNLCECATACTSGVCSVSQKCPSAKPCGPVAQAVKPYLGWTGLVPHCKECAAAAAQGGRAHLTAGYIPHFRHPHLPHPLRPNPMPMRAAGHGVFVLAPRFVPIHGHPGNSFHMRYRPFF